MDSYYFINDFFCYPLHDFYDFILGKGFYQINKRKPVAKTGTLTTAGISIENRTVRQHALDGCTCPAHGGGGNAAGGLGIAGAAL